MEWKLEYTARALPGLPADVRSVVRRAAAKLPGGAPGVGDTLFSGRLSVGMTEGFDSVMKLLTTINALEQQHAGIEVTVADSLSMIRRDGEGQLFVDLDGDMAGHAHDEDWDDDDSYDEDDDDDPEFLEDSFEFKPPELLPFRGFFDPTPLGPINAVQASVEAPSTGPLCAENAQLVRRTTKDGRGTLFVFSADAILKDSELAHMVDADIALLDADGVVLAAETVSLDFDLRARGELYVECALDAECAELVTRVEVGVDAYVRYPFPDAQWIHDGPPTLSVEDERVTMTGSVSLTGFPFEAMQVAGHVTNKSPAYIAAVGLLLEAVAEDGSVIFEEEEELAMIGPGETRPYRVMVMLTDEDEPYGMQASGTYTLRQRFEVAVLTIIKTELRAV